MEWKNKKILVYGASGGIGEAVVSSLIRKGSKVIIGGRSKAKLSEIAIRYNIESTLFVSDITNYSHLEKAASNLIDFEGIIDGIIVTSGLDIRKRFLEFDQAEISDSIEVNLNGMACLTRIFIPYFEKRGKGFIAYLGAFGNGQLTFPGHVVDAASRAGVFTLLEGLKTEHPNIDFLYYCPPSVSTNSEEPWLPLWKSMNVKIITPKAAANDLIRSIEKKKAWYMSGSIIDRFGMRLNSFNSSWARALFLGKMQKDINNYIKKKELQ